MNTVVLNLPTSVITSTAAYMHIDLYGTCGDNWLAMSQISAVSVSTFLVDQTDTSTAVVFKLALVLGVRINWLNVLWICEMTKSSTTFTNKNYFLY